MTVDTDISKVQYLGNGAAREFAVPYRVFEAGHLRLVVARDGRERELASGYTVRGIGEAQGGQNGQISVLLDEPLPLGDKLTILRQVPLLQLTDLQNGGDFNADVLEHSLDYLEMQIQQNSEAIERAVKQIVSSSETSDEYAEGIFAAHGESLEAATRAEKAANTAESSALHSEAAAAQAREDAARAAALVGPASLASGVFNLRKPFVLESPVYSGDTLTLPGCYFPTRDVLWLGFEGVVCSPRKGGVEPFGEYQYSEVGDSPDQQSNQVVLHFDAPAGSVFDMWVVSSAVGANIDAIAALAGESTANAASAAAAAAAAQSQAGRAEEAAGLAVEVVDGAVTLATAEARAQAKRAEGEADRAAALVAELPDVEEALDGQVLVARDLGGVMQAGYENAPSAAVERLEVTLAAALAAGTPFAVPRYIVGSGKLSIFFDGVLCAAGAGRMYQESGSSGAQSTSIIFNETLSAGAEIAAIAAS